MSSSPKSAANAAAEAGAEAEAKAAKRAEVERKVAEGRAKMQQEKEKKEIAAREKLKAEQEEQARKQARILELLLDAQREKDEQLARQIAQREEEEQRANQERQSYLKQLHLNPLEKITEAKDAAALVFKESKFADAILLYQKSETSCRFALQHVEMDHEQEREVLRQHSLCLLSRSLCHFNQSQFEDSIRCCQQVVDDKISDQRVKLKALIRMGQSYSKIAANKNVDAERKNQLLDTALQYAGVAEKWLAEDPSLPQEMMQSIKLLRKEVSDRRALKIDYSKGLKNLPEYPAAQQSSAVASNVPSSNLPTPPRRHYDSDSSSDDDSLITARQTATMTRRGATGAYSHVGNLSDNAYPYSRQRLARFPGIRNEGATCWGNCILQVIFHLRQLRVRLREVAVQMLQSGPAEPSVAVFLISVFDAMDRATAAPGEEAFDSVSALRLWRACETNVLRQNDMHEFFVALIEYFETLFKRSSVLNPQNDAAAFFNRLFNIVSQNRISVEEFGYDQPAGDGSNVSDYVLMIMDPWNQRSLRNFLRFKYADGETVDTYINSALHEGCADKKCPGHKARLFSGLVQCPDVLCCFLNRIEHNYDDGSQSKNSDPFEYPESFSMAEFVHESLGPDSVYDLYAVVVHTGAVLAGHYFSFMRPEVSASTGTLEGTPWYRFDDERVYEVEAAQALVENFGTGSAGHRRNMWNWQTIKYGRTACMLFYVRRSAAAGILASGSAAAAVRASVNGGAAAAAVAHLPTNGGAAAAAPINAPSINASISSAAPQSNSTTKSSIAVQSSSKDIWSNDNLPDTARELPTNSAQRYEYTDLRKALLQLNRLDALDAFQLYSLDDSAVDLLEHEQHLEYLGLTTYENAQLMEIWQKLRGLGHAAASSATASASLDLPVDIKLRSLSISSSSAAAPLAPRSVVSPDASMLPVFNKPGLSMRSIAEMASAVCIKNSNERRVNDSDDENDAEVVTENNVQHLPSYIRAYHPRMFSQLRVFHYRLQHLTGPIHPAVTLDSVSPDASLVLAWTVPSPTHVAVSVCVGTWGLGDPSPTYVGNPVVVYVQLGDEMRVVKARAVECFFQRLVGPGEELARRRMHQMNDRLCLLSESGDTVKIPDEDLVSAYYLQDAERHEELEGSHGHVMNLMLLRETW